MLPSPNDHEPARNPTYRLSGGSPTPSGLISQLVDEMTAAWQRGERPIAEEFLTRHPALAQEPEQAIRLIYEEVCLRQEAGEVGVSAEVLRRFPQWRDQLEVVLHCHRLMDQNAAAPFFPEIGDTLGHLRLLAELGRGAEGRVFLATQQDLADRPVVLKMTAGDNAEHLSLARLWQHTHIVPLYWEKNFPDRNLHVLCMPFLGGTTLARLGELLRDQPADRRTGADLVGALDKAQSSHPIRLPERGPARTLLRGLAYPEAVCWLAAGLADALQYAHERGLVHLDIKPANVLLSADAQPMLLDFHLAREPIPAGPAPDSLGGTAGYMPPEQRAAMQAVAEGLPVVVAVDGRADVYALGAVLYEALSGHLPQGREQSPPLHRLNRHVSVGLSDIVARCLAPEPHRRYARAADLRADLLRHLQAQPLAGVANRSWRERWQKWRRRRPYAGRLTGMAAAVVLGAAALAVGAALHLRQRGLEAQAALDAGRAQLRDRNYAGAVQSLSHGLDDADGLPWLRELRATLTAERARARRAQVAQQLHHVADQVRFRFDTQSAHELRRLERACGEVWDSRGRIVEPAGAELDPDTEQQIRTDLTDLTILWADARVRLAGEGGKTLARRQALEVLEEATRLLGSSPALGQEWARHARALGRFDEAAAAAPRTAWEHYTLGRSHLLAGELDQAARELERAVELRPQEFWPHFYLGACAYQQGRHAEAVTAFSVCTALAPQAAECYYNRALAHSALADVSRALRDCDRALELRPGLPLAALNRGLLHAQEQRYPEALADLQRALETGGDPVQIHYQLAQVLQAQGKTSAALAHLQQVLRVVPDHAAARQQKERLLRVD